MTEREREGGRERENPLRVAVKCLRTAGSFLRAVGTTVFEQRDSLSPAV